MGVWLKAEVSGGSRIEETCESVQRMADTLGCSIEFEFNDVRCVAAPGGSASMLAQDQQDEQRRALRSPMDTRFASSVLRRGIELSSKGDSDRG